MHKPWLLILSCFLLIFIFYQLIIEHIPNIWSEIEYLFKYGYYENFDNIFSADREGFKSNIAKKAAEAAKKAAKQAQEAAKKAAKKAADDAKKAAKKAADDAKKAAKKAADDAKKAAKKAAEAAKKQQEAAKKAAKKAADNLKKANKKAADAAKKAAAAAKKTAKKAADAAKRASKKAADAAKKAAKKAKDAAKRAAKKAKDSAKRKSRKIRSSAKRKSRKIRRSAKRTGRKIKNSAKTIGRKLRGLFSTASKKVKPALRTAARTAQAVVGAAAVGLNNLFQPKCETKAPVIAYTEGPKCTSDYKNPVDLPLREYVIKASLNSAYDGNKNTLAQLALVMAKGYRFIDLNVFSSLGDVMYVGFANDNNPTITDISLPLVDALNYITSYAFTKDTKMTPALKTYTSIEDIPTDPAAKKLADSYIEYPLFLNLRIYRAENSTEDIISKLKKEIAGIPVANFYKGSDGNAVKINGCTPLSVIKNKILISMDIKNIIQIYAPTYAPSADQISTDTIKTLNSFVNIYTGGHTWRGFYNYPAVYNNPSKYLRITDNSYQTNVKNMYITYPYISDTLNPDWANFIVNHSIQTIPHKHYLPDGNLERYEAMFEELRKPFIPLSQAFVYANK